MSHTRSRNRAVAQRRPNLRAHHLTNTWPALACFGECWRNSTNLGRTWQVFCECDVGQFWPPVGRFWPTVGQLWPTFGQILPILAKCGASLVVFGHTSVTGDRIRLLLGKFGATQRLARIVFWGVWPAMFPHRGVAPACEAIPGLLQGRRHRKPLDGASCDLLGVKISTRQENTFRASIGMSPDIG